MVVSYKHKFIFIRVPKTGSTSIINSLSNLDILYNGLFTYTGDAVNDISNLELEYITKIKEENPKLRIERNHSSCSVCEYLLNDFVCDKFFKFAFVRNPWSRVVSRYTWGLNITNNNLVLNDKKINSFDEYVQNMEYDGFYEFLQSQSDFTDGCDYIGKCENLQEEFDIICDKIGIPHYKLPIRNSSTHKHYSEYYTKETEQIIAERYKNDIEKFDYTFEK